LFVVLCGFGDASSPPQVKILYSQCFGFPPVPYSICSNLKTKKKKIYGFYVLFFFLWAHGGLETSVISAYLNSLMQQQHNNPHLQNNINNGNIIDDAAGGNHHNHQSHNSNNNIFESSKINNNNHTAAAMINNIDSSGSSDLSSSSSYFLPESFAIPGEEFNSNVDNSGN